MGGSRLSRSALLVSLLLLAVVSPAASQTTFDVAVPVKSIIAILSDHERGGHPKQARELVALNPQSLEGMEIERGEGGFRMTWALGKGGRGVSVMMWFDERDFYKMTITRNQDQFSAMAQKIMESASGITFLQINRKEDAVVFSFTLDDESLAKASPARSPIVVATPSPTPGRATPTASPTVTSTPTLVPAKNGPTPTPLPKKATPTATPVPPPAATPVPTEPSASSLAIPYLKDARIEIDGVLTDTVWKSLRTATFEARNGKAVLPVSVSGFYTDSQVYLSVSWADESKDTLHRPWVWDPKANQYKPGSQVEDSLAVAWQMSGVVGPCMTEGEQYLSDLWYWRASRTNPSGFAFDGRMQVSTQRIPRANVYQGSAGPVWIAVLPDDGNLSYDSTLPVERKGDVVDRYLPRKPTASQADVTARATWNKGRWTVEISRALETGFTDDAVFRAGSKVPTIFAVYDHSEKEDHFSSPVVNILFEKR